MNEEEFQGPRVTDKRRVDPDSGEVRQPNPAGAPDPLLEEAVEAALVEAEVSEAEHKLAELTADLQRVHAEYANYRKRVERDRESVAASAKAQVVTEFLGVLDDLERAGAHGDLTGAFKAVADKFTAVLTKTGLEAFGHEGEPFDPAVHEAVQHSTSSEVDGPTVTGVLRRGYRLGDKVVRAALVAVTDHEPAAG